tara:strand:+ start:457 stop:702 length:246 start_codon:yes stop_codon:yes gene_type:complete
MFVFDELANNYIYDLERMEIPDYPLETQYSQIDYWICESCGVLHTFSDGEKYWISTDFNSFEGNIETRMCESNCRDSWYMG